MNVIGCLTKFCTCNLLCMYVCNAFCAVSILSRLYYNWKSTFGLRRCLSILHWTCEQYLALGLNLKLILAYFQWLSLADETDEIVKIVWL